MNGTIQTIQELIQNTYGSSSFVNKADSPVSTSSTGVYNPRYGAAAFAQLNLEGNAFAMLPKLPWAKSGWRVITALGGAAADGGIGEGGAVPDSTQPTFAQISTKPKEVAHTFEATAIQDGLYKTQDDISGDLNTLRGIYAVQHALRINQQLLADAATAAGDSFESVDRVTASHALATALSWTSGVEDMYGVSRASNSWADAVVDHNSGTDRVVTEDLIRDTLATLEQNGAHTNVILTGKDTKWRLAGLYENRVRFAGVWKENDLVSLSLNGVSTDDGAGFGVRVASVYGIPVFTSQSVAKDTISRIYLLDTTEQEGTGIPRLFISLLYPTMYFEAGFNAQNPNPFVTGKFTTKGVYYTAGELICTFFKAQGSIRDLK